MAESNQHQPSGSVRAGGSGSLKRAASSENQEIFMLPRQKSRSRERRESRLFLVDGQLCWTDDPNASGYQTGKRHSSIGLAFGSSIDLSGIGQSIDSSGAGGSGSEEAVSYRIKWCRENILQLKRQTWPMEKKLQVLKASKLFIKQHQGELKQSKQARDVIASTAAIFERYWRHFKREFANFLVIITPWEMRIKKIESHFGSVVASYFTFLRWIFWLNLANSLVMVAFVMVPELIENSPDSTGMRKGELGMQQPLGSDGKPLPRPEFNPTLGEMWEFEGFLKFSPIFYGYYSNVEISRSGFWRNPLAFLMSAMLTYLFCFFCISRKLSQNTKLSRIGSKDDEYTFCWTVFVGWDFMIGNSETAYNKTSSLVMNLKEGILEEKEQTKDRDWRLIIRRIFANVLTLMLIIASAYVVTLAVQRSENLPEDASIIQKNELQFVMTGIQFMFPPLFDLIGLIEMYHPRKALSWQLGRILFLDFLNFYTLMLALFGTVDQMGKQLNEVSGNITLLRQNATYYRNLFTTTTTSTTSTTLPPETSSLPMQDLLNSTIFPVANSTHANDTWSASGGSVFNSTAAILTSAVMLANTTTNILQPFAGSTNLTTTVDSTTPLSLSTTQIVLNTTLAQESTSGVVVPVTTLPFLVQEVVTSTSTVKPPEVSSQKELLVEDEGDYPDVNEAIKATGGRLRKRETDKRTQPPRRARNPLAEVNDSNQDVLIFNVPEREFSAHSDELTKPSTTTTTIKPKVPRILFGALIPTIQDPYRKTRPTNYFLPEGLLGSEDEEEEEYLEGRMKVSKKQTTSTTTRKPARRLPAGPLARPIGGVRRVPPQRVQLATSTVQSLDDDINEDIQDRSNPPEVAFEFKELSSVSSLGEGDGSAEQTTPFDRDITSSSLQIHPNYPILSSDTYQTTTANSTDTLESTTIGAAVVMGMSALQPAAQVPTFPQVPEIPTPAPETTTQISGPSWTAYSSVELELSNFSQSVNSKSRSKSVGFNASEVNYSDCIEIPDFKPQEILALNETFKDKLKSLCWETMFGQEMVKIVVMDLMMTVISAVSFEFMRACFVRYCNRFFFWDLERGFPGYQDFKIAENVLHLVNNQTTVWMGMFFAPGLPAINTVKLAVLMYVRSWAVLTCNIPHDTVFKVSKSNNFYYWILLINLLICILPVAYAVTWIRPSWHCGPFGGECRMYIVVTKLVKSMLPPEANSIFRYLTSPGAVIPTLIALILIIYYLASTVSSSKEANKELKAQLKKDKEQEAAVPEITNTTVVDTTSTPAVPLPGTSGSSGAPVVGGAASLLAPSQPPVDVVQSEAKKVAPSKSLLMPPSIN